MLVAFRVDASPTIGTGHVTRCLALAHALRQLGAHCLFISCRQPPAFDRLITDAAFELVHIDLKPGNQAWHVDAEATIDTLHNHDRPDWLVVDHYGLDARWESLLRPHAQSLMAIDDLANRPHDVQALLDQNLQSSADRYSPWVPDQCRRLLGPRFALLRPGFEARPQAASDEEPRPDRPRILACFGGTDPKDILSIVLDGWRAWGPSRPALDIAVGAGSPNLTKIQHACEGLPDVSLHVQTSDMPTLMRRSSLMLCTTGTISWERCALGVPAIMGITADNQHDNLVLLARQRTGLGVGAWENLSPQRLQALARRVLSRPRMLERMSARARRLVDGQGAQRTAAFMHRQHITLRRARLEDADLALAWRNAPTTRRWFFNDAPVRSGDHQAWWTSAVADPARHLLVAMVGARGIGIVRLDRTPANSAMVSIYLDPAMAGIGLGGSVIRRLLRWCADTVPTIHTLTAEILADNRASIAAFESAGFRKEKDHWIARLP